MQTSKDDCLVEALQTDSDILTHRHWQAKKKEKNIFHNIFRIHQMLRRATKINNNSRRAREQERKCARGQTL